MLVLRPHQLLGVLPLVQLAQEAAAKVLQGRVIPVEVEGHGQVHVGGMESQVDVVVDSGLAVGVVVLMHLQHWGGGHGGHLGAR